MEFRRRQFVTEAARLSPNCSLSERCGEVHCYAATQAKLDLVTGGAIFWRPPLIERMLPLKAALLSRFEPSLDTAIVDQVEKFLEHHTSKGPHNKVSQDAVDAVLVTLTCENDCSVEKSADRVGMGKVAVQNNVSFRPNERHEKTL
jgi:hypothetical protein